MKKTVPADEIWSIAETTPLTELILEPGGKITVPPGKQLTLTVDGVHRDLTPGHYSGSIVLSVTDSIVFDYENYGQTEQFAMNAALSVQDGKLRKAESVLAAIQAGSAEDGSAQGVKIRSQGDNFGGIYVDGTGSYDIFGADIALDGHGASDSVGYGAAIAVRGNSTVTISDTKIHNVGSIRTALQVCGHGRVEVNDSEFSAADDDRPNYVKAMSKAPWMLGIHGRVRTTNIQDYGEVVYRRCKVTAENWGAMSTDGTKHVRLTMHDSEITVTGSGYGAYSIGDCHDLFDHCKIQVPDYGVIQCGGGLVTFTGGTQVEAGRNAVMMHGAGAPGLLRVDQKSRLHTKGAVFQIKGRGGDILVDDAVLDSDAGILLEIFDNDDPNGRGMHMGPETVMDVPPGGFPDGGPGDPIQDEMTAHDGPSAPGGPDGPGPEGPGGPGGLENRERMEKVYPVTMQLRNGEYHGHIYHAYSEKNDLILTLDHATLTGCISTTVSSHTQGMPKAPEQYPLIGRVEHFPCPKDTEFGVHVTLTAGSTWHVAAPSYLTELTILEGAALSGRMTVNGAEVPIESGTYSGKIVVTPPLMG